MYKVMDLEGNIIIVDAIDSKLHRHNSGREYTSEELSCRKLVGAAKQTGTKQLEKKVEKKTTKKPLFSKKK